jgi:hypothetical protein
MDIFAGAPSGYRDCECRKTASKTALAGEESRAYIGTI